jgi:hypothetical protein
MHENVINVLANVDWIQSTLPHLPHDDATIGVFLKWGFEYKSHYMLGMFLQIWCWLFYKILMETPLYTYLNITIHHQWASLFTLHMNLEFQILIYNNASDNSNSDNENTLYNNKFNDTQFFGCSKNNGLWKYYIFYCPKSKLSPFKFI